MSNTYNGWKNYETWAVNLWLNNEAGHYHMIREQASVLDIYELATYIREYVEEMMDALDIPTSMFSDLLNAALSEVNWDEIAEGFKEE